MYPDLHCATFEDCGTIVIEYSFPNGTRNGVRYKGTHRTAYLPDNQ